MLVSIDGATQHISQGISQEQGIECTDVNLSQFAKNLNLSTSLVQQMPELLHMQLLASGHEVDNLAPETLTKQYQFSRLKKSITIATLIIGFIGLCAAGLVLKQGLDYKSALNQAVQDTTIQQHQYDEVAKNFSVTSISAADLKTAVQLDKTLTSYPKSPRRVMLVVSAAMEQSPEIQLDRLRWALTNDINIKDEDKLISITAPVSEPQANARPQPPIDPTKLNELGFITAEISGFKGDYRGALNSVHKFVTTLKADARVAAVDVLQEPVNVSSYVNLQGSTTDEQATQTQPALFKLKVILKALDMPEIK